MLLFWIIVLVISGIAVPVLILRSPVSHRWPVLVARIWVAAVVATLIGLVAKAVSSVS